jgi:hypothetical protein
MCSHGTRASKAALYFTRKWPQPETPPTEAPFTSPGEKPRGVHP